MVKQSPAARRRVMPKVGSPRPSGRPWFGGRFATSPRNGATGRTTARTSPATCSATRSRPACPPPRSPSPCQTPRGLVREAGTDQLGLGGRLGGHRLPAARACVRAARRTLLDLTRESTRFGIPPMEGWTPGEVWTAPTAWSAWALVELGRPRAADRLLAELHRAETPQRDAPRARRRDRRAPRPRQRRSPGRTPSRSWRSELATAELAAAADSAASGPPPPASPPR